MKKMLNLLLVLAAFLSLWGTALAAAPDYRSGTPWPDIDLEGVVTEDMKASVKDNFALAVNKDKILALEIPTGYPCGGTLVNLQLKQREDIKSMFLGKAPAGHDQKLAYDLFHFMLDWDSRNAQGIAPLKEATDAIESVNTIDELSAYFLETPPEDYVAPLLSMASSPDIKDSSRNILMVGTAPLLLDDSAEYSKLTDYGAIKKEAFSELARKMLVKLGYTEKDSLQKIDNCLALEKMMASAIYTNEEQHKADFIAKANNYYSRDKLAEAQGKVPVLSLLEHLGYPEAKKYVVISPAFLARLNELYTTEHLPLLKDYLIVHGAVNCASYLDRECYEWNYACSNAITGASGMLPDEDVFSSEVAGMLEWPTARLYADTYTKQADKERISQLADRILTAYHGVISEAAFLSEGTKANAIQKLEAIDKRILFPDQWEKYACSELNFASPREGGTLAQALKRISAYQYAQAVREYSEPVDKTKWAMSPHTVNCCYNPQTNSIYVTGAFSQGGIYHSGMSDEELLGKLGWVIGHEISHAFDSKGAQFDKEGNMKNWWTEEDYAAFRTRNDKMIAYYNGMHPWAGQDFYGSIVTGEAGADMAGMKAVLRIAGEKKDFDYDRFFRAMADILLLKDTLQNAYKRINNVHPMGYLRINCTLQQYDEFLNFYGIAEGDGMYLAPEDRVAIW